MSLAHIVELPVLGIPVRFASNTADVLAIVEQTYGIWRACADRTDSHGEPPVSVRIVEVAGAEETAAHATVRYQVPDHGRLVFRTAGSVGVADVARRDAVAYVTSTLVADRAHFRYSVLEALTRFVLSHLDRQPLHAAAVVRDGVSLLLAGPSGAGKSSVACAALAAGFRLVADDMVYLQAHPRLRVWGIPGSILLPADERKRFPALARAAPSLVANGKRKIEVTTDPRTRGAPGALERVRICVLSRGDACGLLPMTPEGVEEALTRSFEPGFDVFAATIRDAVRALVQSGGWRLTLSADPREAIPFLEQVITRDVS
jgi:hypothetical protein